jgi:16S rRNA (cytidine1402-2'-O)-methyltransferase
LENTGANDLKGEITVVISDKSVDLKKEEDINLEYEINLLINKMSSKDMAEYLAKKLKISKKIIYQNILDLEK